MNALLQLKDLPVGVIPAGMKEKPDFVIGSKVDSESLKNIVFAKEIEKLLNEKLSIKNYTDVSKIKHCYFTFLILPKNETSEDWNEGKSFSKSRKIQYIDIKFPDYEKFCNATKPEALKIMTEQTLRGTEKFLSKVKGFQFEKFYGDLEKVFSEMY